METREEYFKRKYTCRYCFYKSVTLVQMHERTCRQNPNRSTYITNRYGVGHLSGDHLCTMIKANQIKSEHTDPQSSVIQRDPTVIPFDNVKQKSVTKVRNKRRPTKSPSVSEDVTISFFPLNNNLTVFTPITSAPLPVLTGEDVISFFESM